MKTDFYVDLLMQEWGIDKGPPRFRGRVRRVLRELEPWALILLRNPKLQVVVGATLTDWVWARFPVRRNMRVVRDLKVQLRPGARVLLHLGGKLSDASMDYLRDHLGHVLLFLRDPEAFNGCGEAWKEWQEATGAWCPRRRRPGRRWDRAAWCLKLARKKAERGSLNRHPPHSSENK